MKRDKVTTACEECRTKKKKCDGQRPKCQPCQDHGRKCHWSNYSGRSETSTRKYVTELEAKVKQLEHERTYRSDSDQAQSSNQITPTTTHNTSPSQVHVPTGSNSNTFATPQQTSPIITSGSNAGDFLRGQDFGNNAVQALSISSVINTSLSKPGNSYGTASIGNFITQIVSTIDNQTQTPDAVQPFQQSPVAERMTPAQTPVDVPGFGYVLPPRRTSDSLMEIYWLYIHTIFPFVDSIEIETAYRHLWTIDGNAHDDPNFLYILNIMFALASRLSPAINPSQRAVTAAKFVLRAQEVHSIDVWNACNIQSVQAMLLLGLYYHTSEPHQAWMAISLAVRIAQGLGLHIPETSERLPSARAQQLARKVWHSCVMMDCIMAQTYGRPSMLSKKVRGNVPFPIPVQESFLCADSHDPMPHGIDLPSPTEAFVQALKMYDLLADILAHYYSARSGGSKTMIAEYEHLLAPASGKSVLFFERALTEWLEDLPAYLQVPTATDWGNVFLRQAVILRQRYFQIRILLLRPALRNIVAGTDVSQEPSQSFNPRSLQLQLLLQCAVTCVQTAQEAINTIQAYGPADVSENGNATTWMHNILYLYTAATVLVAARLCPATINHISEESISASWNTAIELLKRYEVYGATAKRAVVILQSLNAQISEPRPQNRSVAQVSEAPGSANILTGAAPQLAANENDYIFPLPNAPDTQQFEADIFDLSAFNFEDFSWMYNIPSNI